MRSGGVPRLSSVGAQVLTLSSVRRWGPLAMALGAAGAAFLLAAIQRNLLEILVKNSGPYPVNQKPSTPVALEIFSIKVYSKTVLKAPTR